MIGFMFAIAGCIEVGALIRDYGINRTDAVLVTLLGPILWSHLWANVMLWQSSAKWARSLRAVRTLRFASRSQPSAHGGNGAAGETLRLSPPHRARRPHHHPELKEKDCV